MRSDDERLADILDAVQRIRRHVKEGDRQRFEEDEVLQNAVLRWFERNRVTHGYFDIDLDIVWNTIMNDLPELEDAVVSWLPPANNETNETSTQEPADQ